MTQAPLDTPAARALTMSLRAVILEVGQSLVAVRDGALYLEAHSSFDDYCKSLDVPEAFVELAVAVADGHSVPTAALQQLAMQMAVDAGFPE